MKKFLIGIMSASAGVAFAVESTVATVDVTEINSSLSNTVIAVSALDLAGGDLVISNLVKTTNLTQGDKLWAFSDGEYECWTLSSAKVWERADKTFKIDNSGELSDGEGQDASLVRLSVGKGIWLSRQDTSKPFYIYGAHTNATSVTFSGTALVGNPTQDNIAPQSIAGAVDGDVIAVPTDGNLLKEKRYTYKDGNWISYGNGANWTNVTHNLLPVTAGTGFWYIQNGDSHSVTITWK